MNFLLLLTSTIVILYARADDVVKWCGGWESNPRRTDPIGPEPSLGTRRVQSKAIDHETRKSPCPTKAHTKKNLVRVWIEPTVLSDMCHTVLNMHAQ